MICLELKKENTAFEYVEKSKSRAFLNMLATTEVKHTAVLTNELGLLLEEEKKYLIKLREIQMRYLKKSRIIVDPSELERVMKHLNEIYDKIEKIDPEYVSLRRAKPFSLDRIQKILLRKEVNVVLIEYFTNIDKTLIFVISPHKFELKTIKLSEEKIADYIESYKREVLQYIKIR